MKEFIKKMAVLAIPYRSRLIAGIITGVIGGLLEPMLLIVINFVANACFPRPETDGLAKSTPWLDSIAKLPEPLHGWLAGWNFNLTLYLDDHTLNYPTLIAIAITIPGVMLLRGVFSYLNIYCLQWVAIRVVTDIRIKVFSHLIHLPVSFFNRTSTGELLSRLTSDTGTLQSLFSNSLATAIKDPVTVIGIFAYLLWAHALWTLVAFLVFPTCIIPIVIYSRKVRRSAGALQGRFADLSNVIHESFTGNRIVKAYNLEQTVVGQFSATAREFITHYMRLVRSMEIPGPLIEFIGSIGMAAFFVFIVMSSDKPPSAGDFVTFAGGVAFIYRPIKMLTRLHNQMEQARAASEKVFALLDEKSDLITPEHPLPLRAAGAEIQFENLGFTYGEKKVLDGIDFTVKPGQLVALVGASGSGKTTLTHLLLRFYDPLSGAIRIGGTDIRQADPAELRRQISIVTQETILFQDTIRNNIALGRPGATEAEIIAAAKNAHAHEFIIDKPEGYNAMIGEKGVLLSGGQRQRLAIARAILKNAPILVLDEATSALDTESERAVQAALERLMEGRTTLCIAHRLSTIFKADLIVVFDQGRIVETGTHEELLKRDGHYHKLYSLAYEK
jgi:ATP-binding cassette, subfamily B, bacterial MsbA